MAPLQELLKLAVRQATSAKRQAVLKVRLEDVEGGWTMEHERAFAAVNSQLAKSVTLAYPRADRIIRVFTDASQTHWAGVIVQLDKGEVDKPWSEQACEPLAFVSGAFDATQLKWPTAEKEGYGIKETCLRCAHILQRPNGFDIFTDHRNLKFLFNSEAAASDNRRQVADRIERWMVLLWAFNYRIHYVPGVDNIAADMLTRWAARQGVDTDVEGVVACLVAAVLSDTSLVQESLRFDCTDVPTELEIKGAQHSVQTEVSRQHNLMVDSAGMLVTSGGKIYVPEERLLRLRLFICAHQGVGAHAGVDVTLNWLQQKFWWPHMDVEVRRLLAACSHCLKVKGGRVVPRPLLGSKRAAAPNEILHFDYSYIREASAGTPVGVGADGWVFEVCGTSSDSVR